MDYRNIPGINRFDPVRKDTIVVPYGGYSVIRIWATNPGIWFMHCHIDGHMVEGMALMLNESFENINQYLPDGLPTCHSFTNDPPVPQNAEQTSGSIDGRNNLCVVYAQFLDHVRSDFSFLSCCSKLCICLLFYVSLQNL